MNWTTNRKRIKQLEERISMGKDLLEFLAKAAGEDTAEIKNAKAFLEHEINMLETLLFMAQTT